MGMKLNYRCALVTGASSGLGLAYAEQLAPQVEMLILVSRRESVLVEIAKRLVGEHPHLSVKTFASDLADAASRTVFLENLRQEGVAPDLLVNNAGMGDYGEFRTSDWGKIEEMIRLNMESLTHLSHALLPGLIRKEGAILNVSSLASVLPIPDFAVYAATKAYVTSFSEGLRLELREEGVKVLAVCPGPVKTGFGARARRSSTSKLPLQEAFYEAPETVVSQSLNALISGRARVYPGIKVAAAAALIGILPMVAVRAMMSFRPRKS
jgi:short-subunit dehydrogenase